jgi:lycopene beta-cyclase
LEADLVLVGGGLANSLIAYRLAVVRPEIRVLLIERGPALGGNHTWSFHEDDLTAAQHHWLAPFVEHSWSGYEVRFPGRRRRIDRRYFSFSSPHLHAVVSESLGERVILDTSAKDISPAGVMAEDGRRFDAHAVIDGRGEQPSPHVTLRYQKFLGQVLELETDHGLTDPILMDATVPQRDGFRFIYTLPYSRHIALVEDTRYSDDPDIDREAVRAAIADYARSHRWRPKTILREETGVLPIVLSGNIAAFWDHAPVGVARSGLRAALFHQTTGYSLPDAVRLADELSGLARLDAPALYHRIRERSVDHWRRNSFFRMLNRMLFLAAEPDRRVRVLERFYGLSGGLIRRFYAGRLTLADQARLLSGAPPVPVGRAVRAIFASGGRAPRETNEGIR